MKQMNVFLFLLSWAGFSGSRNVCAKPKTCSTFLSLPGFRLNHREATRKVERFLPASVPTPERGKPAAFTKPGVWLEERLVWGAC